MVSFLTDPPAVVEQLKQELATHPHYDPSREVQEFKGFYLEDV